MVRRIIKVYRGSFLTVCLLASVTCLSGCTLFSSALFPATEPYEYKVTLPPRNGNFDFDRYIRFAFGVAERWDSEAKLESVSRLVPCDEIDSDRNLGMLFQFYRPRIYWFGQRIEWLDIVINEDADAKVSIWTSLNTSWDKPPVHTSALSVDYATALKTMRNQGGLSYEENHDACYLRVVLVENQWNFEYMEDQSGVSEDKLRLCMDGTTGEACEFFYDDAGPQ